MTECGLTNLASCLPEKFFEYLTSIVNAPIQALLNIFKKLLTESPNIEIFYPIWAIIIYLISLFYGLFFLYAGFNFMISGYDAVKRENAKAQIRNVVLMIIFVQSSFFIYGVVLDMASSLTTGIMQMIDPEFFLFSLDSFSSIGLQLFLTLPYVITIISAIMILTIRYILVSIGAVFIPIGIFFCFIPALESYGKMILNVLAITVFVTFFDALVLLGASMLSPAFGSYRIILANSAIMIIIFGMLFLIVFALIKAGLSVYNSSMARGARVVEKYVR